MHGDRQFHTVCSETHENNFSFRLKMRMLWSGPTPQRWHTATPAEFFGTVLQWKLLSEFEVKRKVSVCGWSDTSTQEPQLVLGQVSAPSRGREGPGLITGTMCGRRSAGTDAHRRMCTEELTQPGNVRDQHLDQTASCAADTDRDTLHRGGGGGNTSQDVSQQDRDL